MQSNKTNLKFRSVIFSLVVIIACSLASAANVDKLQDNSDWQISSCCQRKTDKLCGGYYVEPKYPLEITKNHPADTWIINSNQTKLVSKGLSSFDGNVFIAKNNQQLTADHAAVQQNANDEIESYEARGNVKLTEPGLRVLGNFAEVSQKKKYKVIYNANYRIYTCHATGDASKIEIFENNTMHMPNASYTTCQPGNNTWRLTAKDVKLNRSTGRGEAWHAKMYVKNVPVFYWPYVNFPIDHRRQSGFLLPVAGSTSKHGAIVGLPWYWNISENYDYTISPFYLSKRGYKLDNQFRYLTQKFLGIVKFNIIPKDKSYRHFVQEKLSSPGNIGIRDMRYRDLHDRDRRYAVWVSNTTTIEKNWNLYLNYNKVSDSNYLQDFGQDVGQSNLNSTGSSLEEMTNNSSLHLEQSAKLENFNKYGLLKFKVLQYQTLHPFEGPVAHEQYKKMPEIAWSSNYVYLSQQNRIRYNVSYVDFRMRSFSDVITGTTGKRMHFRPSFEHVIHKTYGYIKPRMQLDVLSYTHVLNHTSNKPSRVIPIMDINGGLNFSKNLNNNWQQTLEPKIYYLYVPKAKQDRYPVFDSGFMEYSYDQLFRDNRYSSVDRVSDANQVTIGVKTGLLRSASGEEKASFGIARARYFRSLTSYLGENLQFGKWSPIAMLLNYHVTPQVLLEANIVRQKFSQTRSSTFTGQYKLDDDKIINLGYQYMRFMQIPQHQWQTSAVWTVKDNINLLGKFDYDISQKRSVYSLAGVEFHGCCTILRFAWARSLWSAENFLQKRYDNKFLAQIIFKGFTGIGNLENNYLYGKIPGYKAREKF